MPESAQFFQKQQIKKFIQWREFKLFGTVFHVFNFVSIQLFPLSSSNPPRIMIHVLAFITVNASELDTFLEIFKANVPKVLEEEGCVEYSVTVDFPTELPIQETNPNVVTVVEKWETFAHLQAHFTAPHMLEYKTKVEDIVEEVSLKILQEA